MNRIIHIMLFALTLCACGDEYIIAYKGGMPAWAPVDVAAYDYSDWHSLTLELKGYNPPQYPAVILRNTRIMSVQPAGWSEAITEIEASKVMALDTQRAPEEIAERNHCHRQWSDILIQYGIALPCRPMNAFEQLRAVALTNQAAHVDMTYALALYQHLQGEYRMTDAQIGAMVDD